MNKSSVLLDSLKARRHELGMNNSTFAAELKITGAYWSYLRHGLRPVTEGVCGKVIVAFPWPDPLATLALDAIQEIAKAEASWLLA